ncbi:hypothetical protein I317_00132 [Kwoniella heveanensis CBS 569]|uniref:Uncharacterized protein n=1 Tax=Kwoniella heveanensis BCC8398 TaxID=1296120 RepID=A0A1B9H1J8_9TREE|nr:hypothetical protein I316_01052 [Kwoniella heveanensis BCC8398]OCF46044.1 hypothetical protein I317_00132 [Kwoniella heveanensis CBS 569]
MLHPHIIASSSYDKTTRIWNLRGADAPTPPPGRMPDENYPMADADEGTCVVAVLAGEGGGGHRFYVTYIAFHPTKNAIASCGADRAVKIWTFGTLPEPDLTPAPTPQGYRPTIITSPVMTTTRLFDDFTDYIEWLNEDTLITRGRRQLAIWQWIGYKRYFGPGSSTTRIPDLSPFGLVDCGSVTVLSRYNIGSDLWSITPGFHRGFKPSTPTEKAMSLENPDIVTDPLIALAVHPVGKSHTYPEISLINPLLADETAGPRPKPPRELRARRVSDTSDRPAPATSSKVAPDNEEMTDSQAVDNVTVIDLAESDSEEDDESEGDRKDNRNPTMEPWRVVASPWPEVIKTYSKSKMSPQHLKPRSDPTNICNIAISPRGAEFIVGVGEHETVFVWSLVRPSTKDAAKTKEPDTPKEKAGAEDADTSIGAGAGASTSAGTGSDAGAADSIAVSIVV